MRVIMFGAGSTGRMLYPEIARENDVIAFADNDVNRQGSTLFQIPVCAPQQCLNELEYDAVIISAFCGLEEIAKQCLAYGVPEEKIVSSCFASSKESRKAFLRDFAPILNEYEIKADIAEAGVYRGEFAQTMNFCFPNRTLHLFDTFEGFDSRDLPREYVNGFSNEKQGHFNDTSVELVMSKMPHPEQCQVHKGYFPQSAAGIECTFCFVNLDLDLYLPTYSGLHFFKDKMTEQGVILVHDYFSSGYKGARAAVEDFLSECNGTYRKYPIGDHASIMLARR